MKYAKFTFNSAKIPLSDNRDVIDTPFGANNISNMLHVMMGTRPSPSLRESLHKRHHQIDDIASKAIYRINTLNYYSDKSSKMRCISELTNGKGDERGVLQNSHGKIKIYSSSGRMYPGNVKWYTIYKRYGINRVETYDVFMQTLKECLGMESISEMKKRYSLTDALEKIGKNPEGRQKCEEMLKNIKCTTLIPALYKEKSVEDCNSLTHFLRGKNLAAYFVNVKMIYKMSFDGEIIIPMDDDYISLLENGKRYATLLDGGVAEYNGYVNSIIMEDKLDEGFVNV